MKPLPNVHYGKVGNKSPDWRKHKDDTPDDDQELAKTPNSVKKMLGFDPKEFSDKPIKKLHTK